MVTLAMAGLVAGLSPAPPSQQSEAGCRLTRPSKRPGSGGSSGGSRLCADQPTGATHGRRSASPEDDEPDARARNRHRRRGGNERSEEMPRRGQTHESVDLPAYRSRPVLPTLKLGTLNGSTCLRTFLSKFENGSDCYEWTNWEMLCHLRASLEGPAGQVLWDARQCTSVDDLIRLLRSRFGSLNEEEHYRSEPKARRRRPSESLQSICQDVWRLMALAFPGQSGSMWEIMACDAFLDRLGDPPLRFRETQPVWRRH